MISVVPKDKQVDKIEDFVEFLTYFDLSELPENRRDSLVYELNGAIISLQNILDEYEDSKNERDSAKYACNLKQIYERR